MTTREQAIHWWNGLGSASKTRLVDTNTELLIKGIERRWENLTGREIEKIWRKENVTTAERLDELMDEIFEEPNIYLNRLKEQYKLTKKRTESGWLDTSVVKSNNEYKAMRLFCIETKLLSFDDILQMENSVS